MRTFGELSYWPTEPRGMWIINGEPHVMVRVKRIFGRVRQARSGAVMVADTAEVARDIEWLLDRYPLSMKEETRDRLEERANGYRQHREVIDAVLTGTHQKLDLREPIRPAREYQQVAADLAISTGRLLITDELGLGKSMTGILVMRAPEALPALVVTLTHLPRQWEEEIAKTLPWLKSHIVTSKTPYDLEKRCGDHPDVLIINYHKLAGWAHHLAGLIKTIIFDEAQELRRDVSQKYEAAAMVADQAHFKVGLTATPVYNYGGEIHNVLSVLAPDALGTKEEFTREWGAGVFHDHVPVRNPAALGDYLRSEGLMIGRTRKEVGRELPDVIKIAQTVESDEETLDQLSGDAVEMAKLILASSTSSKERFKASGDLDWKLRQATGIAKAPYVAAYVRLLLESQEQVVLFGWHRAVYDLWSYRLGDFNPAFYTGSESPKQKQASEEAFKSGEARVLIMSLRSGAGLDGLQEHANVAVFGELDWSPQVHNQCIGRLHRDGQTDPVVAYFLTADQGADPVIAEVLNLKRMQAEPMMTKDGKLFQEKVNNADRVKQLAQEVLRRAGEDAEVAS